MRFAGSLDYALDINHFEASGLDVSRDQDVVTKARKGPRALPPPEVNRVAGPPSSKLAHGPYNEGSNKISLSENSNYNRTHCPITLLPRRPASSSIARPSVAQSLPIRRARGSCSLHRFGSWTRPGLHNLRSLSDCQLAAVSLLRFCAARMLPFHTTDLKVTQPEETYETNPCS